MSFFIDQAFVAPDCKRWAQGMELAHWVKGFNHAFLEDDSVCEHVQNLFKEKATEINREFSRGARIKAVIDCTGDEYRAELHAVTSSRQTLIVGVVMKMFFTHWSAVKEGGAK